jgi:hypothetical protein
MLVTALLACWAVGEPDVPIVPSVPSVVPELPLQPQTSQEPRRDDNIGH